VVTKNDAFLIRYNDAIRPVKQVDGLRYYDNTEKSIYQREGKNLFHFKEGGFSETFNYQPIGGIRIRHKNI